MRVTSASSIQNVTLMSGMPAVTEAPSQPSFDGERRGSRILCEPPALTSSPTTRPSDVNETTDGTRTCPRRSEMTRGRPVR